MKKTSQPKSARKTKWASPYKKGPTSPTAKVSTAIALAMMGQSKRKIARTLHMDRETIGRILTRSEVEMYRAQGRSIILAAIPDMAERLVELVKQNDKEMILAGLRGIGVLTQKVEIEQGEFSEKRTYDFTRVAFYNKFGRWPTEEEVIAFDKTLDVPPLSSNEKRA